ncbi:hypothetical protein ACFL35_12665 [Candidatus Riflebacteria bacterium]
MAEKQTLQPGSTDGKREPWAFQKVARLNRDFHEAPCSMGPGQPHVFHFHAENRSTRGLV